MRRFLAVIGMLAAGIPLVVGLVILSVHLIQSHGFSISLMHVVQVLLALVTSALAGTFVVTIADADYTADAITSAIWVGVFYGILVCLALFTDLPSKVQSWPVAIAAIIGATVGLSFHALLELEERSEVRSRERRFDRANN